jgi:hypothetical protein
VGRDSAVQDPLLICSCQLTMAIFTVPARPTFLGLCAMITGTESTVESSLGLPSAYERSLGDSEVSYYLPARADGVNDM